MSSWLHNLAEDSSRQAHWNLEGGMPRPSSNHETLWLLNDDYDDGCMNPPNVSTCSGQRLLTKDSNVKLNKMQNVLSWFFWMINKKNCVLFMYFCEINKFLQSFLTNLCLGFKCSKFATSCVNVSSGPWANALCGDLGLLRWRTPRVPGT